MKCNHCNATMFEISRERMLDEEMDEDLTEGQMADFIAEQLSGELNNYGYTEVTYQCKECGSVKIITEI